MRSTRCRTKRGSAQLAPVLCRIGNSATCHVYMQCVSLMNRFTSILKTPDGNDSRLIVKVCGALAGGGAMQSNHPGHRAVRISAVC